MAVAPLGTPVAIEAAFPDVKASTFGFFPMPLADNQLPPVIPPGPAKFIYSKSPRVEQAKQYLAFLTEPENLQYLLDNAPTFASLHSPGASPSGTPAQPEFLETYAAKTPVYQDVVNYVNPQWIDMGKDMVAMFTGGMTPKRSGQHRPASGRDGRNGERSRPGSRNLAPGLAGLMIPPGRARHAPRCATIRGGTGAPIDMRASLPDVVRRRGAAPLSALHRLPEHHRPGLLPSPTGTASRATSTGSAWTTSPSSSRRGPTYLRFILNTVVFTVATIVLKTVIALGLAVLLTRGMRRLSYLYRAVIFLPAVLPIIVISLIFKFRPEPGHGPAQHPSRGRPGGLRAAWLTNLAAIWRHRRGYLARRRLHHGHPYRRPASDPASTTRRPPSTAPPAGRPSGASRCRC